MSNKKIHWCECHLFFAYTQSYNCFTVNYFNERLVKETNRHSIVVFLMLIIITSRIHSSLCDIFLIEIEISKEIYLTRINSFIVRDFYKTLFKIFNIKLSFIDSRGE
jgi:hypothetical protein